MSNIPPSKETLSTRLFGKTWFALGWVVLLACVVSRFWRVRDALLVWWVYGQDAYFRDGVRVLPGKPVKFTTGELAPTWPDLATGFGFFFVVSLGLTLLLFCGLHLYERSHSSRNAA